jgi:hypothetical protein
MPLYVFRVFSSRSWAGNQLFTQSVSLTCPARSSMFVPAATSASFFWAYFSAAFLEVKPDSDSRFHRNRPSVPARTYRVARHAPFLVSPSVGVRPRAAAGQIEL